MEVFPKRKELASLKQLFVLHGKISIFLHAPPLNAGPCEVGGEEGDKHRFARCWFLFFCAILRRCVDERTLFESFLLLRMNDNSKIHKNIHFNERSNVASNLRPHFLSVKWKERYEALKRKSCLSEASSFPLAEYPTGIAQKVQTAVFLFCYFFSFCCQKEKSNISDFPNKEIPYLLI